MTREPGVCECGEFGFEVTGNTDRYSRRKYLCLVCGCEWEEDWWRLRECQELTKSED